jgi:hypothetical protein
MNRKFTILGFCALIALAALFVFASGKRRAPANQGVVITPDGKVTVTPQRDAWTVTIDKPPSTTNASSALTNSSSISTK